MTILGFLLAAIGLRWPIYGLMGVGILCSIDALTRSFLMTGGLLRYNTFNYWLLLVLFFTLPIQLRQSDVHTWLMRAFAALLVIELAWSPGLKNGVLHMLNFSSVFALFAYFYRCRTNPRMWYILALTVGLSSALGGLAFFFNREGLSFVGVREELMLQDIIDRNYIDPNAFCYVFVTALFALSLGITSRTAKGLEQATLYGLFATNLCWTFLVGSRGGILVASACALYVLFSARSNTRRFLVIAAGVLGVLVVINAFPEYRDRTFHRVDKLVDRDLSAAQRTSSRSDFAVGAWRMFAKSPLGVGTGGFRYSWANLEATEGLGKSKLGYEKSSHSAWLKTLSENGLPGIILFTAFILSFFYAGLRKRRSETIAVGLLVTVVLTLCFLSTQFQSKGIWFVVAAAIVFIHHRKSRPRGGVLPRPVFHRT
jgi:hypothetical protein